jgi:hypothetical protein
VAAPDPVDIRLLSLVAESGRAAVHDIAARMGMDPREVAARLVALSATGLPLIVGVECDPAGLRNAIAGAGAWLNYAAQGAAYPAQQGGTSGPYPAQQGGTSGPYPAQQRGYAPPPPGPGPSGPYPAQAPPVQRPGTQSAPYPAPGVDPISTWGPPQSSSWARGDQPTRPAWTAPPAQAGGGSGPHQVGSGPHQVPVPMGAPQQGTAGETLTTETADGEQVAIHLVEVVDPADFLFTAAGYRLREGERSVVVHTELTNRGSTPLHQLPDLYLVLVAKDGQTVGKAPVSLSSRPPHRIGVRPGETAGGHTVYVLPEATEVTAVRWSARPDDERNTLTWTVQP